MNTTQNSLGKKFGSSLHKAGHSGAGYLKCLLDLLTGRLNVFF